MRRNILILPLLLGLLLGVGVAVSAKQLYFSPSSSVADSKSGAVLGALDDSFAEDLRFEVNVPAVFRSSVEFAQGLAINELSTESIDTTNLVVAGRLTATNVIYSLAADTGSGLAITGDQELVITNTDKGSAQNIFKKFKLGDKQVTAGSNSDTFEFVQGDNMVLSLDESNKKLTISYNGVPVWTGGGGLTYLSTVTDKVGIGTSTPTYKLHVVGTSFFSDDSTFGGDVVLGDDSEDTVTITGGVTSGSTIKPLVDLGADLGSASKRFNNIYVANINTNGSLSTVGQSIFTYEPTSTAYTEATVLMNPTSPVANGFVWATGVGGYQRGGIDAEGDLTLGYNDAVSAPTSSDPLNIYGHSGTRVASVNTSGDMDLAGSLTVGGTLTISGGGISGTNYTTGSVIFQGSSGLAQDNSNFFWDDSTNRLGLGTTSPGGPLGISKATGNGVQNILAQFIGSATLDISSRGGPGAEQWMQLITSNDLEIYTSRNGGSIDIFGTQNNIIRLGGSNRVTPGQTTIYFGNHSTINSSGNFGFGTTSPLGKLHVSGKATGKANTIIDETGDQDIFTASASGTTRLTIKNDGKVGIGTTQPTSILHINGGTGTIATGLAFGDGSTGLYEASSADFRIRKAGVDKVIFNSSSQTAFADNALFYNETGGFWIDTRNGTDPNYSWRGDEDSGLGRSAADTIFLKTNAATALTIDSTQRIGIGTTSPSALLHLSSTSTSLTNSLQKIDWSPGSATTLAGDLFNINIGANGTATNLFSITDNGSTLFSVSEGKITSAIPHEFTVAGDVSFGYDINLLNQSSANLNTNGSFSINAGETWENGTLTLRTYNKGRVIVDSEALLVNKAATVSGQLALGTTAPAGNTFGQLFLTNSATRGKALAVFNQTESQDIFTASSSGTARFTVNRTGGALFNSDVNGDAGIYLREANTTKWNLFSDGDGSDTFYITDAEGDQGVSLAQGATSWAAASDLTLKENVNLVNGSLDKIKALRGVYYNFIGNNRTEVGLIAQEVQAVLPELVVTNNNGKLAVMYDRIAPVLVNAINDQQVQIDKLGNVTTLEDRLTALETQTNENTSLLASLQQTINNIFKNTVIFLADVTFQGRVFFTPDQTGRLVVPQGATEAKVTFTKTLPTDPFINLTPRQSTLSATLSLEEVTKTHFTIKFAQPLAQEMIIDWLATLKDPKNMDEPEVEFVISSPGPTATPQPAIASTPAPTPEPSPTPTPDLVEVLPTETALSL